MELTYRQATLDDLAGICHFTDWWLSGRGKSKGVEGAVDDYFVSKGQHSKYVQKYATWLCLDEATIVGWAVVEPSDVMIHLLVAGDRRGEGIGKVMMATLRPRFVRSKMDQASGNPISFYENLGYRRINTVKSRSRLDIDRIKPLRAKNIDVLESGVFR